MKKNKELWIKTELLLSIIIPIIFIIIGVFLRIYFGENAFPVDYDIIDSYEWANIFFAWYLGFSLICIALHIIIAILGQICGLNTRKAWLIWGVIALLISLIAPVVLSIYWSEESICTGIVYIIYILEYLVTFLVSTFFAPKNWDFSMLRN